MGRKYKIRDSDRLYFVTFTVVEWLNVFADDNNIDIVIDSLNFCQQNKGLEVYAWVIMPNHIHMVIGRNGKLTLSQIIQDFKRHTSSKIRKYLQNDSGSIMYQILVMQGLGNTRNTDFQLWQQHSHPVEVSSDKMFDQRVDYIHMNPVKAGLVEFPVDWKWSSAIDYNEGKGFLELNYT
ncbi:MAG: transposase [Bacteroidota bacterium]